ncbi:uncharacterized protein LOC143330614 [Chaetodon auriga]|uniref:uncharacterized protein LOC143330614 n=1 Tax=Chaetodon auriga TaxID=39042 RepID=UPI004032E321
MEPELEDNPDFKVESEMRVEPDVQEETEDEAKSMFNEEQEVQDKFHVQMNLEEETERGREFAETQSDTEEKYEMADEPIMELEPLDDDNDELSTLELSEVEKSVRAAFQNKGPVNQPLPEDEGLTRERDYVLDEEPIMELEPETRQEQVVPDAASMEEGPALDSTGQQMPPLEDIFPNEEARMGMERDTLSNYVMMEKPGNEFVRDEEEEPSPPVGMLSFEEPAMEDSLVLDGGVQPGVVPRDNKALMRQEVTTPAEGRLRQATGRSCWPGLLLEGKCYRFFGRQKRAEDAELFCQNMFPGGHLGSITSPYIHREVMRMILQHNGAYTRTWVGGLRYLKTGRFIWLDGSRWSYADWLSGEPNDTSGVEDCVELLERGNGKFNDFTCWEPQAFICSYPY